MKIKYIRNAPQGKEGEIKEVRDYEGRVLVSLGFAEIADDSKSKSKAKGKSKANAGAKKDLLLKPNGEPVIDDFGFNVEANKGEGNA